ncbi:MAG: hypothetical protein HUU16_10135 [Candidatus Omnitrophica bacterium]|nr:hypothetical protein [bacterium]NUN96521.1 hypothetical protein [Candidatus Omnitrophota bacterium]
MRKSAEGPFERMESESGIVWFDPDYRPRLEAVGLRSFSDWMALARVEYREVSMRPKRPVVAIEVTGIPGALFVKRHLEPPRAETLAQKLGLAPRATEARKEVEKLALFSHAGIPVPQVIVWGEGRREGSEVLSFVVTLDLEGLPLERHLFHSWAPPLSPEAVKDKRRTIEEVGRLAARMHRAGLVHRDFYLGHIFVVKPKGSSTPPRLAVIDVQRASRRPGWWVRSRIKDLASLHFSADPVYIRPVDRIRFLRTYWKTERFSWWQRLQIRWIVRKAGRIRKHTEKALGIPYSEYFKNKYY